LAAGDVLDIVGSGYDDGKVTVTSVTDTILDSSTDRTVRRCIHVHSVVNPEQEDVWVEGIGSLRYGITGVMLSTG